MSWSRLASSVTFKPRLNTVLVNLCLLAVLVVLSKMVVGACVFHSAQSIQDEIMVVLSVASSKFSYF